MRTTAGDELTIIKTFEYKLYRNRAFEAEAVKALDASRWVYNSALEERISYYQRTGKTLGYIEQSRHLTEARSLPEVGVTQRKIQEDALERLDEAFSGFFRRLKATNGKAGFPRFKGRARYSSFCQRIKPDRGVLEGDMLTVPGVGSVRIRLSRPIEGTVKQVRITRKADGWFVCFVCELPAPEPLPKMGISVGLDVGLTNFATLSTGEAVESPRYLRRAARALKRSQQALSRKKLARANRKKAKQRLALRYLKVQRTRKDFHHKTAIDLVRRFDRIVAEDLQVANMLQNHALAKSIGDAGWAQFLAITQSKAAWAGRVFEKVSPNYTSQTCSACGTRQKMPLSARVFVCVKCSYTLCRDVNAAVNIGRGTPKSKPAIAVDVSRVSRNRFGKLARA